MGHQVDGDADHEKQGMGKKAMSPVGMAWERLTEGSTAVFEDIGAVQGSMPSWGSLPWAQKSPAEQRA